jgi:hypothetical protein
MTDNIASPSDPQDPFDLDGIIAETPTKGAWYKRTWVLVTAAVVVVAAASVIVDLPSHTTVSADIADQTSIMHEINTDVGGCAYAIQETFTIYQDMKTGQLSAADRSLTPSMLRDDQTACSFTNSDIFDLSNVQASGSPAGKNIGQVVDVSTLWVSSDALAAIEDIQNLSANSGSTSTIADLTKQEGLLAKDRARADAYVEAADRILGAKLPMPNLPALPHLVGT